MQCNNFSGTISKNLGKVKKRLVKEMIYGIQTSNNVKLSNIGLPLKEHVLIIKTEERLIRDLGDKDLTSTIKNVTLFYFGKNTNRQVKAERIN